MVTEADFAQWKLNPITKLFFEAITNVKNEAIETLIYSNTQEVNAEYGLQCAKTIIQIQNLMNIIYMSTPFYTIKDFRSALGLIDEIDEKEGQL